MISPVVTLLAIYLASGPVVSDLTGSAEAQQETQTGDVARLEAATSKVSEFSTRILVTTLTARPIEDEAKWDNNDWMEQFCLDWVSVDGDHRFETWIPDPVTRLINTDVEPQLVATWDGTEFRQQFTRNKVLLIKDRWTSSPEHQFLSAFNQSDGPSPFPQWSLAGLLKEAEVQSLEEDGSRVTYSLVMPEMQSNTIEMEFDREPHMRLLAMRIQIRSVNTETGKLELRGDIKYRVLEWEEQDTLLVPMLAIRDTLAFPEPGSRFGGDAEPFMNRIVIKRTSWGEPPPEASEEGYFHVTADKGWLVDDEAAGAKFIVGAEQVEIDGFRFNTHGPVSTDLSAGLHQIVNVDRPIAFTLQEGTPAFLANESLRWRRALLYGGVTFVLVMVGWTGVRWQLQRRGTP